MDEEEMRAALEAIADEARKYDAPHADETVVATKILAAQIDAVCAALTAVADEVRELRKEMQRARVAVAIEKLEASPGSMTYSRGGPG